MFNVHKKNIKIKHKIDVKLISIPTVLTVVIKSLNVLVKET